MKTFFRFEKEFVRQTTFCVEETSYKEEGFIQKKMCGNSIYLSKKNNSHGKGN
jgi:hypothetical protein